MKSFSYKLSAVILSLTMTVIAVSACTIAVVGSSAGGTPMLWKNRDVFNPHQEVRYFDTTPHSFIANVYSGETHRAWSGVNDAGLAIVNTDTYNQGFWGGFGHDDGHVMFHALANFSTVDEFQEFLDSTNITTRRSTHCYGLIDASGSAVMFEAGRDYYVRYDADDAPGGFIVRTNYADCGDGFNLMGWDRRNRAESLLSGTWEITPELIIFDLARDLYTEDLDPYPLPFDGIFGGYPRGVIETRNSINRYYTTSACVIVGGDTTGRPSTMWQYLGQPAVSIPIPLWVDAKALPEGLCGTEGSPFCMMAIELKAVAYTGLLTVDTYILADILSRFEPIEEYILARIRSELESGAISAFDFTELSALQDDFASAIIAKYVEIRSLYISETDRQMPSQPELTLYPNPFNSAGNIVFESDRRGLADVLIYDNLGRLVAVPVSAFPVSAGTNRIPISVDGIPSGRYIAVVSLDGDHSAKTPFVLLK
ncbi:MAG TPA: T9SS type A sorting domain-containing protein [candidate division Zixibacteria bacterium]|nr:T9SS type A sorting domain-containing protein [candidate division Zixibacteria bacterium]